jgi:DNA helicase II / ATP-dependent DNA helicase PcrA
MLAGADLALAARRPSRSIRREVLQRLSGRRQWRRASLRGIAEDASGRLDEFLDDLDALARAARAGASSEAMLRLVRDGIGLGRALETLDRGGRGPEASHRDDLNALLAVATLAPDPAAFEPWLRGRLDRPRVDADAHEVTLSTVHRVKGMEWPHVVVLGAHDGLLPHQLADDVEEERRIFHVAITRARDSVHLLAESEAATRFLDELVGAAPHEPLDAPRATTTPRDPKPPPRGSPGVTAVPGLEVTYSGSTGPIVELRGSGVVIEAHEGSRVVVPYGERVDVDGRRDALRAPVDERLVDALRAWRRDRARADGVPAYVVLHDAHLETIAASAPTTLGELSRCPGIGPTKLERYGEEIIAIVSELAP